MVYNCLLSAFLLFLTLEISSATACTENLCRQDTSVPSVILKHLASKRFPESQLSVESFEETKVESEQHCVKKCLENSLCYSLNLFVNHTGLDCYLLEAQAYSNVTELIDGKNWTHLTVKNSFCDEPTSCLNRGTCIPDYETNSGSCVCDTKSEGVNCENLKKSEYTNARHYYKTEADENIFSFLQAPDFLNKNLLEAHCYKDFAIDVSDVNGLLSFVYFTASETGKHLFKITCSHKCVFYVSTAGMYNRRAIAGYGSDGDQFLSNMEKSVEMVSGRKYFLEYFGKAWNGIVQESVEVVFPSGFKETFANSKHLSAT